MSMHTNANLGPFCLVLITLLGVVGCSGVAEPTATQDPTEITETATMTRSTPTASATGSTPSETAAYISSPTPVTVTAPGAGTLTPVDATPGVTASNSPESTQVSSTPTSYPSTHDDVTHSPTSVTASPPSGETATPCTFDADGDGACSPDDCNDTNAEIYPGAEDRLVDGIDQDCDGLIDQVRVAAGGGWFQAPTAKAVHQPLGVSYGVVTDSNGNVYVSDIGRAQVWKLDQSGALGLVAGLGPSDTGEAGQSAVETPLSGPFGVAVNESQGILYIVESYEGKVLAIQLASGAIETLIDDDAGLSRPGDIVFRNNGDATGTLFITSGNSHQIVMAEIDADGDVSGGLQVLIDGSNRDDQTNCPEVESYPVGVSAACIVEPISLALSDDQRWLYTQSNKYSDYRILAIDLLAEGEPSVEVMAQPIFPTGRGGLAVDGDGTLYFHNTNGDGLLYKTDGEGGYQAVSLAYDADTLSCPGEGDQLASSTLRLAGAMWYDTASDQLYLRDARHQLWATLPNEPQPSLRRVMGLPCEAGSGEGGPAVSSRLSGLGALAFDSAGALTLADYSGHKVFKISENLLQRVLGTDYSSVSGIGGSIEDKSLAIEASYHLPRSLIHHELTEEFYLTPSHIDYAHAISADGYIYVSDIERRNDQPPAREAEHLSQANFEAIHYLGVDNISTAGFGNRYVVERSQRCPDGGESCSDTEMWQEVFQIEPNGDLHLLIESQGYDPYNVFTSPEVTGTGKLLFAMTNDCVVRLMDPDACKGEVSGECLYEEPVAGVEGVNSDLLGTGSEVVEYRLDRPDYLTPVVEWRGEGHGPLYIADTDNKRILYVDDAGVIKLVAGTGGSLPAYDGTGSTDALSVDLTHLGDIIRDPDTGVIYVARGPLLLSITP